MELLIADCFAAVQIRNCHVSAWSGEVPPPLSTLESASVIFQSKRSTDRGWFEKGWFENNFKNVISWFSWFSSKILEFAAV